MQDKATSLLWFTITSAGYRNTSGYLNHIMELFPFTMAMRKSSFYKKKKRLNKSIDWPCDCNWEKNECISCENDRESSHWVTSSTGAGWKNVKATSIEKTDTHRDTGGGWKQVVLEGLCSDSCTSEPRKVWLDGNIQSVQFEVDLIRALVIATLTLYVISCFRD